MKDQYKPCGKEQTFHTVLCTISSTQAKAYFGWFFIYVAFGIGIDWPNIGRVIHLGVPYTVDEYS